jgi:hypothetical protein
MGVARRGAARRRMAWRGGCWGVLCRRLGSCWVGASALRCVAHLGGWCRLLGKLWGRRGRVSAALRCVARFGVRFSDWGGGLRGAFDRVACGVIPFPKHPNTPSKRNKTLPPPTPASRRRGSWGRRSPPSSAARWGRARGCPRPPALPAGPACRKCPLGPGPGLGCQSLVAGLGCRVWIARVWWPGFSCRVRLPRLGCRGWVARV